MCYTGSCKYEDYYGECKLGVRLQRPYPEDASCQREYNEEKDNNNADQDSE